jgi:C4-dicarboxylate-specific signal transduction histidine kinase
MTLGALVLSLVASGRFAVPQALKRHSFQALAVALGLFATAAFAFGVIAKSETTSYLPALLYLPLPLVLWAAVRFGVTGATGAALIVGATMLWWGLKNGSLFSAPSGETNVLAEQTFLLSITVPAFLLGAALEHIRRIQRQAVESEERMALAAASSNIGLWIHSYATGQFWTTQHSRMLFGLPPASTTTLDDLLSRVHEADAGAAAATIKSAIKARSPIVCEFRVPGPTGDLRWMGLRGKPRFESPGVATEMTGTFADITPRKLAQEEAALRQRELTHLMRVAMLGELSGGIAHELSQPLTSILSNAEAGRMLLGDRSPDDDLVAIFDDIISEDRRARDVILHLRSLLKKGDAAFETIALNDLVNSTLDLLHSEFISRRITVQRCLATEHAVIEGDPVQLQQVILNLVTNAIDAMDTINGHPLSGRVITVSTTMVVPNAVDVAISDRGTGLPDHGELFAPFFTTKPKGLGLGLSICSAIIKAHGGSLELKDNPDHGATAHFQLPLKAEELLQAIGE